MGIKEYEFLTETLSDIASLSSEYESEKKDLESLQDSKNKKEIEVEVLRDQLVLAKTSSEDEWRASIEEMKNEIKEIGFKKKIDYGALDKLKPHEGMGDSGFLRNLAHIMMVVLFFIGVSFGYYVVCPLSINFLGNYTVSQEVFNDFDLSSYISLVRASALSSGVIFELPIIICFLTKIGLVTPKILVKYNIIYFLRCICLLSHFQQQKNKLVLLILEEKNYDIIFIY